MDALRESWIALTAGPRILVNALLGSHFRFRVTENCVLEPPSGGTSGQRLLLRIEQPAAGKTVTIHAQFRQRGAVSIPTTASSVTYLEAFYDDDNAVWDLLAFDPLPSSYEIRKIGTATLAGGTVTVPDTGVTESSLILVTPQANGTGNGSVRVSSRVVGGEFVISSTNVLDDASVGYLVLEP